MLSKVQEADGSYLFRLQYNYIDYTVYIRDIFHRELMPGDFVILCLATDADINFFIWNDLNSSSNDIFNEHPIKFWLLTEGSILEYNKDTNSFSEFNINSIFCNSDNRIAVYKMNCRLSRIELLKKDSCGKYYIEKSNDFNINDVISQREAANQAKPGDLVYNLRYDFDSKSIYSRYAIRTGTYDYYTFNENMRRLKSDRKDLCYHHYKVLEPTEEEIELKKFLTRQYLESMQEHITFMAKGSLEPGDMATMFCDVYIYLFSVKRRNRNKDICLYIDTFKSNSYIKSAMKMLTGEVSEQFYMELLDRYDITLVELNAKSFKDGYVGSIKGGITEDVVTKAKLRYAAYDEWHKVIRKI